MENTKIENQLLHRVDCRKDSTLLYKVEFPVNFILSLMISFSPFPNRCVQLSEFYQCLFSRVAHSILHLKHFPYLQSRCYRKPSLWCVFQFKVVEERVAGSPTSHPSPATDLKVLLISRQLKYSSTACLSNKQLEQKKIETHYASGWNMKKH